MSVIGVDRDLLKPAHSPIMSAGILAKSLMCVTPVGRHLLSLVP